MSFLSRIRRELPQFVNIGQYRLRLPPGSKLNLYQAQFRRYDIALGEIARVIHKAYPTMCAIDVGANVGDTAALIRKYADIPVLCIEGDKKLLPMLMENLAQMEFEVVIEPSFVGRDRTFVDETKIREGGLNASLVGAIGTVDRGIEMQSLETILLRHPKFAGAKLWKIDTEGCDLAPGFRSS